ncbi:type II toxin-antitoxin system VapC family toxin [Shimazuella kribbensis]|uniref:type II toxin-antitoxin system VapC family toxin n=1 Tax=Shimazuella kribbensis TaxID=139808 RepID=UPI00041493A2|nr:PIN domain-containing protein [Shimazuella kribbensis]
MGVNFFADVRRIALDTNLFIYAFEQHPAYGETVKAILEVVEEGGVEAVASVITFTEILTKPIREGNDALEKRYRILFSHFPNLFVEPVSVEVAERAAFLRGRYHLKTPDALILATAIISQSDLFITNDQRLSSVKEIRTMTIDELREVILI